MLKQWALKNIVLHLFKKTFNIQNEDNP